MDIVFTNSLTPVQKKNWIKFWEHSSHSHPRQHPDFSEIIIAEKRKPIYVLACKNEKPVLVGLFSVRPVLWSNRRSMEATCISGPVFDDVQNAVDFLPRIVDYFRRLSVGRILIRPYWLFPEAGTLETALDTMNFFSTEKNRRRHTGIISIEKGDEELLNMFSKSARREVRRAQRNGLYVREAYQQEKVEIFIKALNQMHRNRGLHPPMAKSVSTKFYERILKNRDLGIVLNAYKGNTYLGGLLMIRSPHTAHTSYFVINADALKELSNLRLAPLVWWCGMRWARDKGCSTVDVEGFWPLSESFHPDYFVHKYKGEFNPAPTETISQHAIDFQNLMSKMLAIHTKSHRVLKRPFRALNQMRLRSNFQKMKK